MQNIDSISIDIDNMMDYVRPFDADDVNLYPPEVVNEAKQKDEEDEDQIVEASFQKD